MVTIRWCRNLAVRKISRTYRLAMTICRPMAWWGRLEVTGLDVIPDQGPLLIACNHDSHWDPVMIGIAALRKRQIRALAKSSLWDVPGLSPILNAMGQIPIVRGSGDTEALRRAIDELKRGVCIGIFPEGTISRGHEMRARSGIGRLAQEVPEARIVLITIEDSSSFAAFPRRPRVKVTFFEPALGQARPDEDPGEIAVRLVREVRELVPPVAAGRRAKALGS